MNTDFVAYVSIFTALISVVLSTVSILLSNRPYIEITLLVVNGRKYMRLKNYGNQTAIIKRVSYDTKITEMNFHHGTFLPLPFVGDKAFTLAPQQSKFAHISDDFINIDYKINYSNGFIPYAKKGRLESTGTLNFVVDTDRETLNSLL